MAKAKQPENIKKSDSNLKIFSFKKINNILLLTGLGLLAIGYLLMIGGGTDNPNEFNPAIFNFQRLTLAPILITLGFIVEIFAIMFVQKDKKNTE